MEGCVLCQNLAAGDDARHHVLARSEYVAAILNLYPYNNGHLMILPYAHVPSIEDLPPDALTDLMLMTRRALAVLRRYGAPDGFNIGANLGSAAGAGIEAHFHLHVVPRWRGDSNFMSVTAATRTIPEMVDETYARLHPIWEELYG
jgi:ATP adenylyltransferase